MSNRTPNSAIEQAVGSSPQEFGAFFKAGIAKWTRIVEKAGIRAD